MAKRLIFLFVIVIVYQQAYSQSKADTEVAAAVEAFRLAMINPDNENLKQLVSDRLSYGHSSGKIENKEAFMRALLSGESNFDEIQFSDQTIDVIGNMAIVRHRLSGTTNDKGKSPGTVNIGVMQIWVKEKKQWQLVARQAYKL